MISLSPLINEKKLDKNPTDMYRPSDLARQILNQAFHMEHVHLCSLLPKHWCTIVDYIIAHGLNDRFLI